MVLAGGDARGLGRGGFGLIFLVTLLFRSFLVWSDSMVVTYLILCFDIQHYVYPQVLLFIAVVASV
jgi:hypothetical protein